MKKLFALLTACSLSIASLSPITVYADDDIKVYLNGDQLEFEVSPIIIDDTTFVPMRKLFEELGSEVTWNESDQSILSSAPGVYLYFVIGSNYMERNSVEQELDVAPFILNGTTLLPLRIVSECFGCNVIWDGDNKSVFITTTDRIKKDIHSDGIYYVGEEEIRSPGTMLEMHDMTGYGALYNEVDDSILCMGYFEIGNIVLGTLFLADGSMYRGEFINGQYEGNGTYYYANGDIYIGEFKNGKADGHGSLYFPDGTYFIGSFKNGEKDGYGSSYFATGDVYEGSYVNGKRYYGTYRWADGHTYEGFFVDEQPSGNGTYHW